jgi:hypothetical protein
LKICKSRQLDLIKFPTPLLNALNKKDRLGIIELSCEAIESLPNTTKEEWLFAVKKGYQMCEKIPDEMWSEEMCLAMAHKDHYQLPEIPERFKTPEMALKLVSVNPKMISIVPSDLITNEILRKCASVSLASETIPTIPESAWDMETAELAVADVPWNIQSVPKKFATEELCLKVAKFVHIKALPVQSYPVLVAYVSSHENPCEETVELVQKIKDKETFILDVLKAIENDKDTLIYKLGIPMSEGLWLKILKVHPTHIRNIERCNQTPAMVDIVLNTATTLELDRLADVINLGKIKAHHAPLLIGCENSTLAEMRNKFFKANATNVVTDSLMEIDIAPSEYAKIKGIV